MSKRDGRIRQYGRCLSGAALLGLVPMTAAQACTLALVLGMDVSASVDAQDYLLQMQGTAAALISAPVQRAVASVGPVAMAAFLWSGPGEQVLIADWRTIRDGAGLEQLAAAIAQTARPGFGGQTATGEAMAYARLLLDRAPDCGRQVLDLASDGEANAGRAPGSLAMGRFTVNALAIGGDLPPDHGTWGGRWPGLSGYLEAQVIRGPDAFVEPATDYRDVARAMERKLLREIGGLRLGALRAGEE